MNKTNKVISILLAIFGIIAPSIAAGAHCETVKKMQSKNVKPKKQSFKQKHEKDDSEGCDQILNTNLLGNMISSQTNKLTKKTKDKADEELGKANKYVKQSSESDEDIEDDEIIEEADDGDNEMSETKNRKQANKNTKIQEEDDEDEEDDE